MFIPEDVPTKFLGSDNPTESFCIEISFYMKKGLMNR